MDVGGRGQALRVTNLLSNRARLLGMSNYKNIACRQTTTMLVLLESKVVDEHKLIETFREVDAPCCLLLCSLLLTFRYTLLIVV